MSFFRKHGIVNVKMVITEEKILSNIEKVQRLINPASKKQIIELEEDSYFKDLIDSIKTYLIEYPKKKNFPVGVYKSSYDLVEFATNQFEENTKRIEELIKQREQNISLASDLKDLFELVTEKDEKWSELVEEARDKFSEDVIDTLSVIGRAKSEESQNYNDAVKLINAKINNLEKNLHIEIEMERIEDRSKALSYIGIEVAEALKQIPIPVNYAEYVEEQKAKEQAEEVNVAAPKTIEEKKEEVEENVNIQAAKVETVVEKENIVEKFSNNIHSLKNGSKTQLSQEASNEINNNQDYQDQTTFEVKPKLWDRIKSSKFVKAISSIFKIRITIQMSNALPEGNRTNGDS